MKRVIVYHHSFEQAEKVGLASRTEHMFPYTDVFCGFSKRHIEALAVLWLAGCYERVAVYHDNSTDPTARPAELTDEDLCEIAFELTNHIDKPWNRPNVRNLEPVRNSNNRSSSVGDIFEVIDDNNISKMYRVASCGFEPFEEYTEDQLQIMAERAGHIG